MTDLGSLNTQYQHASRAAGLMDQIVEELQAGQVGAVTDVDAKERRHYLGRYLATTAGLVDPAWAGEVDSEFANAVPASLVVTLGEQADQAPNLPGQLVKVARDLKDDNLLEPHEVELVTHVARMATVGALELSQEILAH
jgi:hypothetical protein